MRFASAGPASSAWCGDKPTFAPTTIVLHAEFGQEKRMLERSRDVLAGASAKEFEMA